MYEPVSNKPDFAGIEMGILDFWQKHQTFRGSMDARRKSDEFVFYDGPPFATGLPHYGHLLAGTIKDIVPRYRTMKGSYVERRFGWDCHGLPVEYEVEQDLKVSGKTDIEKMGVGVFNERCRSIVLRYTAEWRQIVTRMGRWVDFDHDYKTMDAAYMESIWWVFKSLWEKGLIYEGNKILPYCPRCSTPLSNFETNQGYEEVKDPAITLRFAVQGQPNTFLLAWTTTPWTLPSNMALAVGADITYARVEEANSVYYLARERVPDYYRSESEYRSLTEVRGSELVGWRYEPLFPYFAGKSAEGAFRVVAGDFVSTAEGTGIVHMAPGFGEDDYELGRKEGIPIVCPVDAEGRFTGEVPDYAGRQVKEADADIMARLKREKKLIKRAEIVHSYPHCWRCDTPLIYRAVSTWFVRVEQLKERLLKANSTIHWVPEHLKDGRFGKWLEGARDWAISRNRYWGTPLPVWKSDDGKEVVCVGSIAELESMSGKKVQDLHKHFVDGLTLPSRAGKGDLKRIPEVLDCWFESGAMPYAQAHYPFENKEHFEKHFPADFIAEGLDQTRGWFYTLMVLSVALFDKPAFRNVVVNGLVLAEDGRKMSKRLKNYPDPAYMINTYGADALRLYLVNSPVVRAEDLRFSEEGVKHLMRHILIPLWNAYSFFVTYANVDKWHQPETPGARSGNVLDRWILSSLATLTREVAGAMDSYDLQRAIRPFVGFVDNLTNWYIRRSRRRFWKSQNDGDKADAYSTLCHVLLELSRIAAPMIPFISEAMYRNLRTGAMPDSVHLCDFPEPCQDDVDPELEAEMADAMAVVRLGRSLRTDNDLKVRQPLATLRIVSRDGERLRRIRGMQDIILDELNVKQAVYSQDETGFATFLAKADFKKLGPRLGAKVKTAAAAIASLDQLPLGKLANGESIQVQVDGQSCVIGPDDVVIQRTPKAGIVVATEGAIVVALETELTPQLVEEGIARELVNKVQNMRKAMDLEVTRRISVEIVADTDVANVVSRFHEHIAGEVLARNLVCVASCLEGESVDLNGHACTIRIIPA